VARSPSFNFFSTIPAGRYFIKNDALDGVYALLVVAVIDSGDLSLSCKGDKLRLCLKVGRVQSAHIKQQPSQQANGHQDISHAVSGIPDYTRVLKRQTENRDHQGL